MRHWVLAFVGLLTSALAASAAPAVKAPLAIRPSVADTFRLGDKGAALCQVQSQSVSPAIKGLFDRAFSVVCRDAAQPVGHIYVLRKADDGPAARLENLRAPDVTCPASNRRTIPDLGEASVAECRLKAADVAYRVTAVERGKSLYVAEGLAGYDSALILALRSIIADKVLPGEVSIALTSAGDAGAFARVQAGSLDRDQAMAEGFRRNASGSYAEAAEFFDFLMQRDGEGAGAGESIAAQALQKSNMGAFAEADALFRQADAVRTADPEQMLERRNFHVLHLMNQGKLDEALRFPAVPVIVSVENRPPQTGMVIDARTSALLNDNAPLVRQLGASDGQLTPAERMAILNAQAKALGGVIRRLKGDDAGALLALQGADSDLAAVRGGRVTSSLRMRAQIFSELSILAERRGDYPSADKYLRDALTILTDSYPGSIALNAAKARYAGYLGRRGQNPAAMALYREVVATMSESGGAAGMENLLSPYFALLVQSLPTNPKAAEDLFLASECLVRPGVADTQAVLARELSGGADEASRLFRQSVTLGRDVEAARIDLARLRTASDPSAEEQAQITALNRRLADLRRDQAATQGALAAFPRYRAVGGGVLTLAQLQAALRPGEAYAKLAVVGDDIYAIFATSAEVTAWKVPLTARALDGKVDALRETVSTVENGQRLTYPFDAGLARTLYGDLFSPVSTRMARVSHLIFEPDGAMLRLPLGLLITEQAGVDAYNVRSARRGADEFDFTGIAWLGRDRDISTAVSAKGFVDVRKTPASAARNAYLGLGQNAPAGAGAILASATKTPGQAAAVNCTWPTSTWSKPVLADELVLAKGLVGNRGAQVVTDADFTDTGVTGRSDLSSYRIIHFATHGLVTAPKADCPARPALLTSFGATGSDGLLSFLEIYNLHLDADLIILSACDTAGQASVAATREAGVTTGGGSALDGLVRAFIGAGARSVIASHWPVPDEFDATQKLIGGLFEAPAGTSVGAALRAAERKLMDDPRTSHPYYWAGFAVVGDAAQPVLRGS
ncbi:MAG: CHAT domain-containing protein [Alphaproteobacteria bacterium]